MNSIDQRRLAFHGALVFVLSLLTGSVFMASLVLNWGAEPQRAWGAAHRAPILMAVWMLAISAVHPKLILTQRAAKMVATTIIWGVYMIFLSVTLSAIAQVRGLAFDGPAINVVAWSVNGVGGVLTLVGAVLVALGARNAMREVAPDSAS